MFLRSPGEAPRPFAMFGSGAVTVARLVLR